MFSYAAKGYKGDGAGFCWPNSPSGTGTVKAVFGPRPFSSHINTVGYDYDFHRGVDINVANGSTIYSPITGAITRRHFTHFGWDSSAEMNEWTLTTPSSALSVALGSSLLACTCARVGAAAFPAGIDTYQATTERVPPQLDNWVIEINLGSAISLAAGAIGVGMFNADKSEYVALEYDGATFTMRGVDSGGALTNNGGTNAAASKTWLRIEYTQSTDTIAWRHSTGSGTTWTDIATEATHAFSNPNIGSFIPTVYWRSGDTNGTPYTINLAAVNWYDDGNNIGRFGNFLQVCDATYKVVLMHLEKPIVTKGQYVHAGQAVGVAGTTGFDARSGRIQTEHLHVEISTINKYEYINTDPVNILNASYLPRTNLSNNVSVVRTTGNDPDGANSHILTITCTRGNEDFDLNQISLTGTVTKTVNFDTRSGLNADNDIPKQGGVYLVPSSFNENSANYSINAYFNVANVGATFTSYAITDCNGTTLASE